MNKITLGFFRKKSKTITKGYLVLLEGKLNSLVLTFLFLALANAVEAQTTTRFNDGYITVFKNASISGSNGSAIVLEEYLPSASSASSPNFSVNLPNTAAPGSTGIVAGGTTTSNGAISRSENGRYILVPGWSTNSTISTAAIGVANSANLICAVRPVNGIGTIGTGITGTSNWFNAANDYRGATSDDGTNYWVTGGSLGVRYTSNGTTLVTLPSGTTSSYTSSRTVNIFNGNLYYSTGSGNPSVGIYQIGSGKPTTASQTATMLVAPAPYSFSISPDGLTIYAVNSNQIFRYTYNGTSWSSGSVGLSLGTATGLVVDWTDYTFRVSGTNGAVIYASNTPSSGNSTIVRANDNGTSAMTGTIIASVAVNGGNIFKQIAFSPIKQTISKGANTPATGNITQGSSNTVLFQMNLSADEGNSTVKKVVLATAGTAVLGTDISNFRILNDANDDGVADASEISASLSTGTVSGTNITFSSISLSSYIAQGSSINFLIIGDVAAGAAAGTFTPSIASNKTINSIAYTSNVTNAGGSVVTMGTTTNTPTGNTLTIISSTTWNGTAWSNGAPTASLDAIIAGNYSASANITAKTLTVNNGAIATILSGNNVTVTGAVTVTAPATLTFSNNANLIQDPATTTNSNGGAITVNRNSNALKRGDYTLWSSPVASQNLAAFSPLTSIVPNRFYIYNPATDKFTNTVVPLDPLTTNFSPGAGYSIRMPNENPAILGTSSEYYLGNASITYNGVFTGIPNNGDVSVTLSTAGQGYNLVGNPYPSAINLFTLKSNNNLVIGNTFYMWRKTNNGTGSAYCSYVPTDASTGTFATNSNAQAPNTFVGDVQVGQGFFVSALTTGPLVFKNGQRRVTTASSFFKTKQPAAHTKVWLNATNASGYFSQMAVTYFDGATVGVDDFDGKYISDSEFALTSNINNGDYTIQGRPAFDASDVVALNFKTDVAGEYTIAIDHSEGVFASSQDIYLVDSKTGTETNLKNNSYTFAATAAVDNARFSLKFQKTLGTDAAVWNDDSVLVYKNNGTIYVNSGAKMMNNIKVFDIQGRLIAEQKNVKTNAATISNLKVTNQALIVQITSEDNKTVNKKILN